MDARLVGRVIDVARTVNPLLAVNASVLDLHQAPASGSVRAQVAARLADGTFRVLIDGKALKLALPADIKPGDVLQLRVIGREVDTADAAHPSASTSGKSVSSAGQLVADLVRQPPGTPPRQTQPILELPPQHSQAIPAPLARAVERSGLFYESHQARWVSGDYPFEQLMQEPQAHAGQQRGPKRAPMPHEHADASAGSEFAARAGIKAWPVTDAAGVDTTSDAATTAAEARDAAPKVADKAADIVARETLAVVRQQLETLETRHFQWLGEIWPGQTMQWEIGEGPGDDRAAVDASHEWDSRFALALPALGNVGAELLLSGNRLRIRVNAEDETTVAMMRDAAHELRTALQAAGIEPSSFEVMHRESVL